MNAVGVVLVEIAGGGSEFLRVPLFLAYRQLRGEPLCAPVKGFGLVVERDELSVLSLNSIAFGSVGGRRSDGSTLVELSLGRVQLLRRRIVPRPGLLSTSVISGPVRTPYSNISKIVVHSAVVSPALACCLGSDVCSLRGGIRFPLYVWRQCVCTRPVWAGG